MKAILCVVLVSLVSVACDGGVTRPSQTIVTSPAGTGGSVPPQNHPEDPAPTTPTPPSPPSLAPCSVQVPPKPGTAKMLVCVVTEGGTIAVGGAEVFYGGTSSGFTDANGQFMLALQGYGGTRELLVKRPGYVHARVQLALREENVSVRVDLVKE